VAVACTTTTFAVGGNVAGLSGTGLVLQNNGGDDVTVNADGAFSFSSLVPSGGAYAVTVRTQPSGGSPVHCTVSNGSGTIGSAAPANINVTCSPRPAGFLYVPNQASNDVSAYAIDANTGALTAMAGSPFVGVPSPAIASVHPSGKFLYVSGRGSPSSPPLLAAYAIDASTGALTMLQGSPFALSVASPPANGQVSEIGRFLIHSSGRFGYLTIPVPTGRIYGLAIDPATGLLSEIPGMPITLGYELYTATYASAGTFIYFPHILPPPDGFVTSYSINQPSGVLTQVGQFRIQSRGATMAVLTPNDELLLTPNQYLGGSVSVMDVNPASATMAPAAGSPVTLAPGATTPFALTYHRRGNVFYVTDASSPTVFGFRLNTTTAAATAVPNSPYTVGTGQLAPAVLDPQERFLFVPLRTANGIQAYTIDQATGALTAVAGPVATGSSPAVVADPSGRFLFVSNTGSHTVSSYSINAATGALTLINTLDAGQSPQLAEVFAP
jgi:6-phosphogluconolactonase (cycloisomerase 2 family)